MKKGKYIPIIASSRPGSSQKKRLLPQANPEFVKIDGRSMQEKLRFFSEMSGMVNFFDLTNSMDGSWRKMFEGDVSFILASMAVADAGFVKESRREIESGFVSAFGPEQQRVAMASLYNLSIGLAQKLGIWLASLNELNTDPLDANGQLAALIRANCRRSIPQWKDCLFYMLNNFSGLPSGIFPENVFRDVSFAQSQLENALKKDDILLGPEVKTWDNYPALFNYLKQMLDDFLRSLIQAASLGNRLFPQSLELPSHKPQSTLALAFQAVMEKPIDTLNSFSRKHLDFYFRNVLQLAPKAGIPDHVFIHFSPTKGDSTIEVPKGTALGAGKSASGATLIFNTDEDLFVNQATISSLKTIFNQGPSSKIPWAHSLWVAPVANSAGGNGKAYKPGQGSWDPMGSAQSGKKTGEKTMEMAQVGLMITDPILFLSSGKREVSAYFILSELNYGNLENVLKGFAKKGEKVSKVFSRLLSKSLLLSYSGLKSWEKIILNQSLSLFGPNESPPLLPESLQGKAGFYLQFSLPESAPAWEGCNAKAHGLFSPLGKPALRILLNQNDTVGARYTHPETGQESYIQFAAYNLFRTLRIAEMLFEVKVKGKVDFTLQNDLSVLSAKKPFSPFGPRPEAGAGLMIGSPEVFRKQLSQIRISITWGSLPKDKYGFSDYYQTWTELDLLPEYHNSSFQVKFSLLKEGEWKSLPLQDKKGDVAEGLPMFTWHSPGQNGAGNTKYKGSTKGNSPNDWLLKNIPSASKLILDEIKYNSLEDGTLSPIISFDGLGLKQAQSNPKDPAGPLPVSFAYSPESRSGFLRVELETPVFGFGDNKYLDMVHYVNQANITSIAERPSDSKDPLVLLNPPVAPFQLTAKSLKLDYAASQRIGLETLGEMTQVFFIRPFGTTNESENWNSEGLSFMPDYDQEGCLYIGLENVEAPQILSFYFEVDVDSAIPSDAPSPRINWAYMWNEKWVSLPSDKILADSTSGFIRSGIVKISLEKGHGKASEWFQSEKGESQMFWLRASSPEGTDTFCKIQLLETQAVRATYQLGEDDFEHLSVPMPAGIIKKPIQAIPGIAKTSQPYPSFSGIPPETESEFFTRIHDRIRHKQRGINPWDLERLVLDKFAQVGQVNCFRTAGVGQLIKPGNAVVAVFPSRIVRDGPNKLTPKLSRSALLNIKNYLDKVSPYALTLDVQNPDYEYLQVLADISFASGYDPGFFLKKLNEDLTSFIAPWAFEAPGTINPFETQVSPATIKGFIQTQEYVASLDRFQLMHFTKSGKKFAYLKLKGEFNFVQTRFPWGILASVQSHLLRDSAGPVRTDKEQVLGMVIIPYAKKEIEVPQKVKTLNKAEKAGELEYLIIEIE